MLCSFGTSTEASAPAVLSFKDIVEVHVYICNSRSRLQKERLTLHGCGNHISCVFLTPHCLIRKVYINYRPRSACEYHYERILYVVQQQES